MRHPMQKLKTCKSCQKEFPLEKFPRKYGKPLSGYRSRCSPCFEKHRRLRNPKRLKKSPHKGVREKARLEYGPTSQWACSVLMCESPASDLHHFDYSKALSVIPLCREHHFEIHGKDFSKKDT